MDKINKFSNKKKKAKKKCSIMNFNIILNGFIDLVNDSNNGKFFFYNIYIYIYIFIII